MLFSAQRPARDRAPHTTPRPPPRRAALCAEPVESAQAAGHGAKRMRNSTDLAASGESVVREFLQRSRPPICLGKPHPGRVRAAAASNGRREAFWTPPLVLLNHQFRVMKRGIRADPRFERLSEVKSPWLPARKMKAYNKRSICSRPRGPI
jgi:hypothetical protein